jgi:glucose-6-phosphate isomerase
LRFD